MVPMWGPAILLRLGTALLLPPVVLLTPKALLPKPLTTWHDRGTEAEGVLPDLSDVKKDFPSTGRF